MFKTLVYRRETIVTNSPPDYDLVVRTFLRGLPAYMRDRVMSKLDVRNLSRDDFPKATAEAEKVIRDKLAIDLVVFLLDVIVDRFPAAESKEKKDS